MCIRDSPSPADPTATSAAAAAATATPTTLTADFGAARFDDIDVVKQDYYESRFGVSRLDGRETYDNVVREVAMRYAEGLAWCFAYYYQGCPSWVWFYPFHYAPLPSDVRGLAADFAFSFTPGEPFRPFLQLLACLPPYSGSFLPKPYRDLMTLPSSPLAKFYPEEFEVDMSGKVQEYEGVPLLPFIDEVALRRAVEQFCPDSLLTADERRRNTFGSAPLIIKYDASVKTPVESTVPSVFPSLLEANTSAVPFVFPPPRPHVPNPLPGHRRTPGDSQLLDHPLLRGTRTSHEHPALHIFNRPARTKTTYLLVDDAPYGNAARYVQSLVAANPRGTVWCNYPYLHECQVVQVADMPHASTAPMMFERGTTPLDHLAPTFSSRPLTPMERNLVQQRAAEAQQIAFGGAKFPGTGGVHILSVARLMVLVRPLNGMVEDAASGAVMQRFDSVHAVWVPAALTVLQNPIPDPRFVPRLPSSLVDRFPASSPVVCVGATVYGLVGSVVRVASGDDPGVLCRFPATQLKLNDFGHLIASTLTETWFSLERVAANLELNPLVADAFLGSFRVTTTSTEASSEAQQHHRGHGGARRATPEYAELGLNLRVGKGLVIPHYARLRQAESSGGGGAGWTYREAVVSVNGMRMEGGAAPSNAAASAAAAVSGGRPRNERDAMEQSRLVHDRGNRNAFEYSARAVDLLARYKAKFPALFERALALLTRDPDGMPKLHDVFPMPSAQALQQAAEQARVAGRPAPAPPPSAAEQLKAVRLWLTQIPSHSLRLAPVTSKFVSMEAIQAIQRAADEIISTELLRQPKLTEVVLPPEVLYRPPISLAVASQSSGGGVDVGSRWTAPSPTSREAPALGDRVLNLGDDVVPFGAVGTVVGVIRDTSRVEVLFDRPFLGGTDLNGACRPRHGAVMKWAHLLNLSRRVPVVPPTAAERAQLLAQAQAVAGRRAVVVAAATSSSAAGASKSGPVPVQSQWPAAPAAARAQAQVRAAAAVAAATATAAPAVVAQQEPEPLVPRAEAEVDDLASYWENLLAGNKKKEKRGAAAPPSPKHVQPAAVATPPPSTHAHAHPRPPAFTPIAPTLVPQQAPPQPPYQPVVAVAVAPVEAAPVEAPAPARAPVRGLNVLDNLLARAHKTEGRSFAPSPSS